MHSLRVTAIALVAACAVVLTACGGDDTETTASDATPGAESSATADDTASATPDTSETTEGEDGGDIGDFPDVEGFTYTEFPDAYLKKLDATLRGTPPVQGGDAKLVEMDGKEIGLVIQAALDPDAASADGFDEGFLPAFAGGVAGADAVPKYEDINGIKVLVVEVPDQGLTAYAWVDGAIATSLLFKDAADAEAFAQGALA